MAAGALFMAGRLAGFESPSVATHAPSPASRTPAATDPQQLQNKMSNPCQSCKAVKRNRQLAAFVVRTCELQAYARLPFPTCQHRKNDMADHAESKVRIVLHQASASSLTCTSSDRFGIVRHAPGDNGQKVLTSPGPWPVKAANDRVETRIRNGTE
jgi:hypothetical protein